MRVKKSYTYINEENFYPFSPLDKLYENSDPVFGKPVYELYITQYWIKYFNWKVQVEITQKYYNLI